MAKGMVYSNHGVLKGVFSNKKNLWDFLIADEDVNNLSIKLNETKTTELTYSKVVKYLKERTMLQIYYNDDLVDYEAENNIENCPTYVRLWEVEINKPYKLGDENDN